MAGCVTFVCFSASASSPNIILVIENPKVSFAFLNIFFASADAS